ncbi:SymE family type I addiction module toxin [Pectobacterium sp. B2J-2]|uniref:SymE family type I addiction module toxin n=1 Tax=Pectobacterium sp. B2J-2 TaxID=3385372 RepID=UPI0038FC58A4
MSIKTTFHHGELPELTLTGDELALAGDWLTQSGLLGQPLNIDVLPGKITIRAEQETMLA